MFSSFCPSQQVLKDYASGRLDSVELEVITSHVYACDACTESLSQLQDRDSLVEAVQNAIPEAASGSVVDKRIVQMRARSPMRPSERTIALDVAVSLEQFVKQLEDTGILAGETLKDFLPPKATPKDAEDLARELVRQNKLTTFQAEEVYCGKGNTLVLGNYLLLEKIGAGGMGQVFKARHRRMDRVVAVKLLPTAMTMDKAAIVRFEREVKAAAKITHRNIVTAYDADCANGIHFLVMECVDGSNLSALVKECGPFAVDQAVNFILQAATGMDAAHAEGVVHRDIKPANLLLDKKGTVKVLDMGLARIDGRNDAPAQAELTSTQNIMGTVDYMAPEQALNTKTADARADIYSLGCSLFYLLTGRALYDGDTLMAKLLAHREQPIPSLRATRPEASELLDSVFSKMVAKKVENRYQSMTEVVADLKRCRSVNKQAVTTDRPYGSSADTDLFDFRTDPFIAKPAISKSAAANNNSRNRLKLIMAGVVGGLVLLSGLIIKLNTKDGTLIVEVNEPGAVVQVLDEEGKVEITRKSEMGTITISVDPGKHQLKVEKDGFTVVAKEFEIRAGDKQAITAQLIPMKNAAVVDATPLMPMKDTSPLDAKQVKTQLAFQVPGFDEWMKSISKMAAEKQVEAVVKKLQELNPDFAGKEIHTIENDVVVTLKLDNVDVTDISPVRALVGLKTLRIAKQLVSGKICELSDLSPLKGLKLTELEIGFSKVSDLSPLKEMKLEAFRSWHTNVSDLSPLAGMPLKSLHLIATKVTNLSPLQGMPLVDLSIAETEVSNLSPLKGLKLIDLNCGATKVSDLSPLKDMKLEVLCCWHTNVSDLSPLAGMPLKSLLLDRTKITSLSPLRGMPLEDLRTSDTAVSDLSPLAGMPLRSLICTSTRVKNLLPLKGMLLTNLALANTPVDDLSPLAGMPLKSLALNATKVTDLSSLKDLPLKDIWCDLKPQHVTEVLRTSKTLERINFKPVAKHWKEVDEVTNHLDPLARQGEAADRDAAEWVKRVGGKLGVKTSRGLERIKQPNQALPDEPFDLMVIDLPYKTPIHERDFHRLRGLSNLITVSFAGCVIGEQAMTEIGLTKSIQYLNFWNCSIGDEVARSLSPLTELRFLNVGSTRVTFSAIEHMTQWKELKSLHLEMMRRGTGSLEPLSKLKSLLSISLWRSEIQDDDLDHLAPLENLRYLALGGTSIGDKGLAKLKSLKQLKVLNVHETKVTEAGIADFQTAVPQCRVEVKMSLPLPPTVAFWPDEAASLLLQQLPLQLQPQQLQRLQIIDAPLLGR